MVKRVPSQLPLADPHPEDNTLLPTNPPEQTMPQGGRARGRNAEDTEGYQSWFPDPNLTFRGKDHIPPPKSYVNGTERSRPGEAALEDYEMQLMLLEQQNKKRLAMVRAYALEEKEQEGSRAMREAQKNAAVEAEGRDEIRREIALHMQNFQRIGMQSQKQLPIEPQSQYPLPPASFVGDKEGAPLSSDLDNLALQDYQVQSSQLERLKDEKKREKAEKSGRAGLSCHYCAVQGKQACELGQSFMPPQKPMSSEMPHSPSAMSYAAPFCNFMTSNPTVFHAVRDIKDQLKEAGFQELSERDSWDLKPSGAYYVDRNGSSLVAFTVGAKYKPGNGAAILAGHIDAITAKLKPVSTLPSKAGYLQVAVAPYASGLNKTWWDRDLGVGGRVLVREESGKIVTKLVKLDWPVARIPTLAEHFGAPAQGPFNLETQMVPIFGLTDEEEVDSSDASFGPNSSEISEFQRTQPPALVKAIAYELGIKSADIVNWELELFDVQPATLGGLKKDFIFAGRIDDKLCSWAAIQALLEDKVAGDESSLLKVVGLFDDEEIGSLLRQGARSNFLPSVIERAVGALSSNHTVSSDIIPRTYANSFMVSSDVIHAVNPNFLNAYLEKHSPSLNVGVVVSADSNGHMTTDAVSTAILKRCAEKSNSKLQVFQIRNDSRSGGTVGPMLSSATGIRAIDAGIPQLSMHSIRATTGSKDPGLGVQLFKGFLKHFEEVDKEFR